MAAANTALVRPQLDPRPARWCRHRSSVSRGQAVNARKRSGKQLRDHGSRMVAALIRVQLAFLCGFGPAGARFFAPHQPCPSPLRTRWPDPGSSWPFAMPARRLSSRLIRGLIERRRCDPGRQIALTTAVEPESGTQHSPRFSQGPPSRSALRHPVSSDPRPACVRCHAVSMRNGTTPFRHECLESAAAKTGSACWIESCLRRSAEQSEESGKLSSDADQKTFFFPPRGANQARRAQAAHPRGPLDFARRQKPWGLSHNHSPPAWSASTASLRAEFWP